MVCCLAEKEIRLHSDKEQCHMFYRQSNVNQSASDISNSSWCH